MNYNNIEEIAIVGGARPNFMKIAPLVRASEEAGLPYYTINTGQHFDEEMVSVFFNEFNLRPDFTLNPNKESMIKQFADIIKGLEEIFKNRRPSVVVVVGDVNSTLAGALTANKMGIPIAHVEAGLRSYNNKMPEEKNRILTDHLSDFLFVTMEDGVENLRKEGIVDKVFFVGNIMIDTICMKLSGIKDNPEKYFFCTLHRPENVDHKDVFSNILSALEIISKDAKIYLPLHPRTKKMAKEFKLMSKLENIFELLPPLSYSDSLFYQKNAELVLTDSGGIQEETTFLRIPCLTIRTETERPITVTHGTNVIGGVTKDSILQAYRRMDLNKKSINIPLWDGKAAGRVVRKISEYIKMNILD